MIRRRFTRTQTLLVALSLAAAALVSPLSAWACSCDFGFPAVPAPESIDVPTNPLIWIDDYERYGGELVLFAADSTTVPLDSTNVLFEGHRAVALRPAVDLQPLSRYELWLCLDGVCGSMVTSFTTSGGQDVQAPSIPTLRSADLEVNRRQICGPSRGIIFRFEDDEPGLLVAAYGETLDFDPVSLEGSLGAFAVDGAIWAGRGGCWTGWPGGDEQIVRFGQFDAAGNFSGWSEPREESLEGCGCTTTPAHDGAPLGDLIITLAVLGCLRSVKRSSSASPERSRVSASPSESA